MAANALPIRFTELLQVRLMADDILWVDWKYQLTGRIVQLTHTEIDVRSSKLQLTSHPPHPPQGHTDIRIAKIYRLQFLCESHSLKIF